MNNKKNMQQVLNIGLAIVGIGFVIAFALCGYALATGDETIKFVFPRACSLLAVVAITLGYAKCVLYGECPVFTLGAALILLGITLIWLYNNFSFIAFGVLGGIAILAGALVCIANLVQVIRRHVA